MNTLSAIAAVALLCSPTAAQETLKFAHVYEADTLHNEAAEWIAAQIEERTDGAYIVDVFPSSQLGNEEAITEGLQIGSIQMAYTGPTFLGQFYKPMAISGAPFIWKDYDHWKSYQDSEVFEEVSQGYFDQTGNKVTSILYFGSRQTSSQEKIEAPADMEGMKIRVANAPLWKIFPTAVGAKPGTIRVDNGPEYISETLRKLAEKHKFTIQHIQPGQPQQNAYVERYNRTVRHE